MNSPLEYTPAQWKQLQELRQTFLAEDDSRGQDYWNSPELLRLYDDTFAQRIGWKWDAVIDEVAPRLGVPSAIVDFGCGTGIAVRRWLSKAPASPSPIFLLDRSVKAMEYARAKIIEHHPAREVHLIRSTSDIPEGSLFLASHVANELNEETSARFLAELRRASSFLWVEPGTKALAQKITEVRETLSADFRWLAPCPHQQACGMRAPENAAHWCHHFAKPPRDIFGSGFWKKFSDHLKIDLRSLPLSYLAGHRDSAPAPRNRVIGRARVYKGYAKALICDADGVTERRILSRHFKSTVERLEEGRFAETLDPAEWGE